MPQANLKLSPHDQQVLDSIFDPLELSSLQTNNLIPAESDLKDVEPDTQAITASRELELRAIGLSESGELDGALELFQQSLNLAQRASHALDDLNKALELANDQQTRTKCHAHCQRGVLYRKLDNLEAARADFEAAAQLGSKFAREQLVEINPFAALCNQMLRQAFDQLK
ncbi:GM24593 [Drosophila sechellia]|uniref:GM24593 n=1 Tax=Drosophila sechellia TaxID=7238 RepID=B4HGS8_DROSE|nr:GM24593 [Drosophila sechellia]